MDVCDGTQQKTTRARTERTITMSAELERLLGQKGCCESEFLPLLLTHGYVRSVSTIQITAQPLSGDDLQVTLDAAEPTALEARLAIASTHGPAVELQELYLLGLTWSREKSEFQTQKAKATEEEHLNAPFFNS
jgi:hypothetical protein